ncbi:MAG TPA: hypothetical protein VHV56_01140 [Pseudolabrys sp.]|jgi:hypothetical protein|nr:hypothetical protein [Pseudolabrys sp.]
MNRERLDHLLAAALKRPAQSPQAEDAAAARVLARLAVLPRQKRPLWRWPAILVDWDFAPAWPRMAALAGCLAIGFTIGLTGVDRHFDRLDARAAAASGADLGLIVYGPEPLTGARP